MAPEGLSDGPSNALAHGLGATRFWQALDELVASSEVKIDRPAGSRHPRSTQVIYPLDYGFLTGTSGGEGDEVDVWRGSLEHGHLDAAMCTVDLKKRDVELKLLLGCTEEEKRIVWDFHTGTHTGLVLMRRGAAEDE